MMDGPEEQTQCANEEQQDIATGLMTYVGTKEIQAEPEDRLDHGDTQAEPEAVRGYGVVYPDGYRSWSPKDAFEDAYQRIDVGMSFGGALFCLKTGRKVQRQGWNGKDMWIVLMPGKELLPHTSQEPGRTVSDQTAKHVGEDVPVTVLPYISMWTADEKWLPGWLASQTDMLADDWVVVD